MKAYQFIEWQKQAEFREVTVPEVGHGQILIKIGGAGACHSDLHVMEYPAGMMPYKLPFTLGHENAGWIEKIGKGVEGFSVGDPVAIYGPWGCGLCYNCRQGFEIYCENAATVNDGAVGGGFGIDGGMAKFMLVPNTRFLIPLSTLHPREAAPLTDAGLTPYHAIKLSMSILTPRATVVVIGVGGLGHMAIQFLRVLTGARVIAVDIAEDKLKLAKEVGADEILISDEDTPAKVAELTLGRGAEVVLDIVGTDATMALAAKMSCKMGHVTIVGAAGGSYPFSLYGVPYECKFTAPIWGSIPELIELIVLAENGSIRSHNTYYPLDQAQEAYDAMRSGSLSGRAVIVPNE